MKFQISQLFHKTLAPLYLASMLSACGGGGGSGNNNEGNNLTASLTANKTSLNFTSRLGELNPEEQNVRLTVNNANTLTGTVHVLIEVPDNDYYGVNYDINGSSGNVYVGVSSASSVGLGSYQSEFKVRVCTDSNCNNELSGSPKTISVNYEVTKPQISLSASETNTSAKQGLSSEIERLTIWPTSFITESSNPFFEDLEFEIEYDSGASDWLTISPHGGDFLERFKLTTSNTLDIGTYEATITAKSSEDYLSGSIKITHEVTENEVSVDTNSVNFQLTNDSTLDSVTQTIDVISQVNWHPEVSADWLMVESNDENNVLTISLSSGTSKLNNGAHQAEISIVNSTDNSALYSIPVSFNNNSTHFRYALPYYSYIETEQLVTVYGEGFEQLNGTAVYLGDMAFTDYQVIDDNTLTFTPTNLAVNKYPISLGNEIGDLISKASYTVIDSIELPAATLSTSEHAYQTAVYEPQNQSIFYISGESTADQSVECITLNEENSAWLASTVLETNGYIKSMRVSIDGQALYIHAQQNDGIGNEDPLYEVKADCSAMANKVFNSSPIEINAYFDSPVLNLVLDDNRLVFTDDNNKELFRIFNLDSLESQLVSVNDSINNGGLHSLSGTSFNTNVNRSYVEAALGDNVATLNPKDLSLDLQELKPSNVISNNGEYRIRNNNEVYDENENLIGLLDQELFFYQFSAINGYLYSGTGSHEIYEYDLSESPSNGKFVGKRVLPNSNINIEQVTPDIKNSFVINDNYELIIGPIN